MKNDDKIELPYIGILSDQGETMKIKELNIQEIGGIKKLHLSFDDHFNVICGENGIGKTTILDIITSAFAATSKKVKKKADSVIGHYHLKFFSPDNSEKELDVDVSCFEPGESTNSGGILNYFPYTLFINNNRDISYHPLPNLKRDPDRYLSNLSDMNVNGINYEEIKSWFVTRYLFNRNEDIEPSLVKNFELARRSFSILDDSITFKSVKPRTFDILLQTDKGDIYFEYLSSGYKSCICILFGLMKEIEYRFKDIPVEDFDGIILIDELELHLHPIWQSQLSSALKTIFPNAQFIITTHSPSVLQNLKKEEIIPLIQDEDGNTIIKELNLGEFGLQGWTLEEILKDVMGMSSLSSKFYSTTIAKYDDAMNHDDHNAILKQYDILMKMLHPDNPLRKLIELQVAEYNE